MPASISRALRHRFAALAVALVASAPAQAADEKTLICVEENLTSLERAEFVAEAETSIREAEALIPPDTPVVRNERIYAAFERVLPICATRHGWSSAESYAAGVHVAGKLQLGTLAARLRKEGIDPAVLDRAYYAVPEADRNALSPERMKRWAVSVVGPSIASGMIRTRPQARLSGVYIGLLHSQTVGLANFLHS
jgi:hypothetical protein